MEWTQLKVTCGQEHKDQVCAIMMLLDNQLMIEDYSDIDMDTVYADLIDESILQSDKSKLSVSIYISEDKNLGEYTAFLRDRFRAADIACEMECVGVDEEAWSTAWRKYYHPTKIGEKLVVVPLWEEYDAKDGEVLVHMDPGMAFGTGTHETTRLCASLLEKYVKPGDRMLDVGTGSGILAICGSLLGIGQGYAYDIDPVAVRVAKENMVENGVSNVVCGVSDLLKDVDKTAPYTICTANIVADIIIRMAPEIGSLLSDGAVYITSGIIDTRKEDVLRSMTEQGFVLLEELHENGWVALAFSPARA